VAIIERHDAKKETRGPKEALALAERASRVLIAKGSKLLEVDMAKDRPSDEVLLAGLIGPSGNLRAPTVLVGKTLLVGFHEGAYEEVFG
jgi:hypothetical protein